MSPPCSRLEKCFDFFRGEFACFSAGQGAEPDIADSDACQPPYFQMEIFRHASDFPVFPFAENKFVMPRTCRADGTGAERFAFVADSGGGQNTDRFRCEFSRQTDPVGFFHFIARMREPCHKITVVGKQNQPFAVLVQASGGDQTHGFRLWNQIHCFLGGMTVFQSADISARFVEHDVKFFRRRCNGFAVEPHLVAGTDPHGSAFRRDAVDGDSARRDEFPGTAP